MVPTLGGQSADAVALPADLDACFARLGEQGCLPDARLAAMLVGSTALGWANDDSDFDFYIVVDEPFPAEPEEIVQVPPEPGFVAVAARYVGDRRCELKYWLDSQVDAMLARVGWEEYERMGSVAKPLSLAEELFLGRLSACVALDGADWVDRRKRQLDDSALRPMLVGQSLAKADAYAEDALGQLSAGDVDSAVLSAHLGLGHTVDALLESRGVFGSATRKWRARRFRAAALDNPGFDEYWRLQTMAGFDPSAPGAWVIEVVSWCKDLEATIEI